MRVNLSGGGQPVAGERFRENKNLAFFSWILGQAVRWGRNRSV